ncbi:unnamed protein product [Colias eurytheme]|nr:unnamed protein product [Colias eurytheme]
MSKACPKRRFSRTTGRLTKPVQPVLPTTEERPPPTSDTLPPPIVSSAPSLPPPSILPSALQSTVPSTIPIAAIQPMPKSIEAFKPPEESNPLPYPEKPTFVPPKSISQSPKISPSSIPNPSPSVATTKQVQGYPNYGCYMYSVPVYSAFQPVSYPVIVPPNTSSRNDQPPATEVVYPLVQTKEATPLANEDKNSDAMPPDKPPDDMTKSQTDFEEHFTPKVVSTSLTEKVNQINETKIENKIEDSTSTVTMGLNKDSIKKPPAERFSLKTSIPISKIDMKCVTSTPEGFQAPMKKHFNPAFHTAKSESPKIEIQSNVLINDKSCKDTTNSPIPVNSISTLISAAEVINQAETQFRKPEPKLEPNMELKKDQSGQPNNLPSRPTFNAKDISKPNLSTSSHERSINEQKNQILLIQNKNSTNQKMLLAIQQQNPQVLLQRTTIDQKNAQPPSRPSSQIKKCKEELISENGSSSKVVSLKRTHQGDCDENDFENLITENQIYGNKIVVKEKTQGTLQEQEIKTKNKTEKPVQIPPKNVVLQSNFVYLSNVQFPANVMMFKNNVKVNNESSKVNTPPNEIINKILV